MKEVEPIRDLKKVEAMKRYLKGKNTRDYALFVVGLNLALRISDLLSLQWEDILDPIGKFKAIRIIEGKTKKRRTIHLNKECQKALREYMKDIEGEGRGLSGPVFRSRKGKKAITRQMASIIIKEAAQAVGVEEEINTHSLRKTWGYHAWKAGFNPAIIMETLNHSNLSVTKRYLGITQSDVNDLFENHLI